MKKTILILTGIMYILLIAQTINADADRYCYFFDEGEVCFNTTILSGTKISCSDVNVDSGDACNPGGGSSGGNTSEEMQDAVLSAGVSTPTINYEYVDASNQFNMSLAEGSVNDEHINTSDFTVSDLPNDAGYLAVEVDGSITNELQNLWQNFTADSGSVGANSQTDTLEIAGGGTAGCVTTLSGDKLWINCTDTMGGGGGSGVEIIDIGNTTTVENLNMTLGDLIFNATNGNASFGIFKVGNDVYVNLEVLDTNTQNSEATTESMIFDNDNIGTMETTGNITANQFYGLIDCSNITGGSDGNYCADATGASGSGVDNNLTVGNVTNTEILELSIGNLHFNSTNGNSSFTIVKIGNDVYVNLETLNTDTDTKRSQEEIEDFVGAMVSGNIETLINVSYNDTGGFLNLIVDQDLSNYNNDAGFITSNDDDDDIQVEEDDFAIDTSVFSLDFGNGFDVLTDGVNEVDITVDETELALDNYQYWNITTDAGGLETTKITSEFTLNLTSGAGVNIDTTGQEILFTFDCSDIDSHSSIYCIGEGIIVNDALFVNTTGDEMTGNLEMNSNNVTEVTTLRGHNTSTCINFGHGEIAFILDGC